MNLDFSNVNTLWSSVLVETLFRLGITTAVVCPGSRSGPLTTAFARHPHCEAIPILDERSAGFFALGQGKITGVAVALVCTSGTAGANFYPAVIEARESAVPMLVLTADRPPELRHCHSGQSIDQQKLFGTYPTWQLELGLPSAEMEQLRYLRQTLMQAVARSRFPVAGAVHLNLPFRDPLAPTPHPVPREVLELDDFFAHLVPPNRTIFQQSLPWEKWRSCDQGIIIAGVDQPWDVQKYCSAIAQLSKTLGWVVLAEGLSPVRNYHHRIPHLISTYDFILRNQNIANSLIPKMVIQIGAFPTSKILRTWLSKQSSQCWVINEHPDNFDPLHQRSTFLHFSLDQLPLETVSETPLSSYQKQWLSLEAKQREIIDRTFNKTTELIEPKIAWFLSHTLPEKTPLFIANSLPVRDVEWFWQPNHREIYPLFNRGANGIDGTLSTALGIAHQGKSAVCLTGDLALLYDTNGFLSHQHLQSHLTIILVNNQGGGIFELLPIAQFPDVFEQYFATPQNINFSSLCAVYQVEHQLIQNWQELSSLLNPLPKTGIRVLEIKTNRAQALQWREQFMNGTEPQCF